MNDVSLGPTGETTSRLGIGMATLMREPSARKRQRLLETAYEMGFRHFDTAPSYGLGAAEATLAPFLRRRRDSVTVATKFGLVASTPHPIVRLLERPLRAVLKAMPGLRRSTIRAATQAAGPLHHPTDFSVENAAASLAQSLRALETDYVDMLLLHEVRPEDLREEALLTWLRDVQAQGRVGRIGLATSVEASAEILTAHPDTFDVVQVPVNPLCGPLPAPVAAFDGVLIAHSVFNPVLAIIQDRARDDGRWGDEFQRETGVDPTDKEALARHLVAAVSQALPHGIVLVGASSPEHIRVAPSYLNTVQLPPDALGQLARLVSRGGSDPS